jgi:phage-related holin
MKYTIMIIIVVGLAIADFCTGIAKGYINSNLSSKKMRQGGINKLTEIVIMLTACGLEIGMNQLGKYYDNQTLSAIAGSVTAVAVFSYIVVMEIISLLENYSEIDRNAAWVLRIIKKLQVFNQTENGEDKKESGEKNE